MENNLKNKTVRELREIAKDLNISGRWDMTKQSLIENIEKASVYVEEQDEEKIFKESTENKKEKIDYVENVEIGTLVAFETEIYGRTVLKTAAVKNISKKLRLLKLETKYGKEFVVPFEKVVWVRTNGRWPRGVYERLKENESKKPLNNETEVREKC